MPDEDGMLLYMSRGFFGGYEAKFSRAPFYRNTTLYSESEMRNLWHYSLDLDGPRRRLLVAHLWEIMGKRYEYLFLTENCASRIARTLELIVDAELVADRVMWVSPEAVTRAIASAKTRNGPLVSGVQHVPSRRLKTERKFSGLTFRERRAVQDAWHSIQRVELNAPTYRGLAPHDRAAVIETLLSHVRFLKESEGHQGLAEVERRLLQERLGLPTGARTREVRSPAPIHQATPPSRLMMQGLYSSRSGPATRIAFRVVQYDLLDSDETRQPNAELELGKVEVDVAPERLALRRLDLFRITNLHAQSVPLPASPTLAWHASLGWRRVHLGCSQCGDGHLTFLAGKAWEIGRHTTYIMGGGDVRTARNQDGIAGLIAQMGLVSRWSSRHRTLLRFERREAFRGLDGRRTRLDLQYRLELDTKWDFRLGVQSDLERGHAEFAAGVSRYF